ncbi:MAG: HD domain-containing protein [Termitinemataceae bacterium]|nr:MAG: HD domain-containing protein [Termitinemataceae bacterium]
MSNTENNYGSIDSRSYFANKHLLQELADIFAKNNKQLYLVGGAVRDMFLNKKSADWDLTTDAKPEEVCTMFSHVIPTGIKHGTVTVRYKGHSIEVTTFRSESDYTDGRHPGKVEYAASIEEDLSRRDFTMNSIALNLQNAKIVDPFNGRADIKNRLIRAVGNAEERFKEDGLRPMRALRFASQLSFSLDESLLNAIPRTLNVTAKVSMERIHDEFEKIISSKNPIIALEHMQNTGLLKLILPQLASCAGVMQKGYHKYDVLIHSLLALDYAAKKEYPQTVRLASLFHDIGKPKAAKLGADDIWTFYNHEKYSCEITNTIMINLKYPNAVREEVLHLIKEHMFNYEDCWSDAAVRRFIARCGEAYLDKLFMLRLCDSFALAGVFPPLDLLMPFQNRIEDVLQKGRTFSLKHLAVNGSDLINIGITNGKRIGIVLHCLLEAVIDDPALNEKSRLLEIAHNMETIS